jgi:hypothetical protein
MRLSLLGLFLGFPIILCGCARDREAAQVFGNMTYFVSQPLFADRATLVNGDHEERSLSVHYEDKYVYGDFNHDGLKDAAVVIFENYGGNADYYQLAFLINDGKELIHRVSYSLDTWAIVNSLREKDGKVIVDMYIHQKGDCNAGPSRRVRSVYQYSEQDDFATNRKL